MCIRDSNFTVENSKNKSCWKIEREGWYKLNNRQLVVVRHDKPAAVDIADLDGWIIFEKFPQFGDEDIQAAGGEIATFDSDGDMMVPPPPPLPPMHPFHVNGFKMTRSDPFAMDPDDKDIITYDKKDIGKGLEKITIVRKKHTPGAEGKEVEMKVEVTEDDKK